jgi:hypothetical protein
MTPHVLGYQLDLVFCLFYTRVTNLREQNSVLPTSYVPYREPRDHYVNLPSPPSPLELETLRRGFGLAKQRAKTPAPLIPKAPPEPLESQYNGHSSIDLRVIIDSMARKYQNWPWLWSRNLSKTWVFWQGFPGFCLFIYLIIR